MTQQDVTRRNEGEACTSRPVYFERNPRRTISWLVRNHLEVNAQAFIVPVVEGVHECEVRVAFRQFDGRREEPAFAFVINAVVVCALFFVVTCTNPTVVVVVPYLEGRTVRSGNRFSREAAFAVDEFFVEDSVNRFWFVWVVIFTLLNKQVLYFPSRSLVGGCFVVEGNVYSLLSEHFGRKLCSYRVEVLVVGSFRQVDVEIVPGCCSRCTMHA